MTDDVKKIGITTTIPIEIIFAAGAVPIDLNNLFITGKDRRSLLEQAEIAGFPASTCGWIKGIYSAAKRAEVDGVVGVMAGDCSNTQALLEIWQFEGMDTHPFAFPYDRSRSALELEVKRLCARLGTDLESAQRWKSILDEPRKLAAEVDRLTWEEDRVTGNENHLALVSASDFEQDPECYGKKMCDLIKEASEREPINDDVRLGYIGVPPILDGFHDYLESLDARVVFNETQRQFSMPFFNQDLIGAYTSFTYPYDVFHRIDDIKREIERRRIDGVIHYVQSFCFRQMEDIIFRKTLGVPILTVEGDRPMEIDARTKTRLESFVEMLAGSAMFL